MTALELDADALSEAEETDDGTDDAAEDSAEEVATGSMLDSATDGGLETASADDETGMAADAVERTSDTADEEAAGSVGAAARSLSVDDDEARKEDEGWRVDVSKAI